MFQNMAYGLTVYRTGTETVTLGIIVEVSALSSYHVFEACEIAQGTPSRNLMNSNQIKARPKIKLWHVTCLDIYYLRNTYLQNNNFKQELILKATFCQKTPLNYILNSESFNNCLDSFYTLSVDKNRLF